MFDYNVIIGLLIATLLGHIFIWLIIDKWLRCKNPRTSKFAFAWMLGIIERILYFIAFLIQAPQWIAFWITAKIAITWHPGLVNKMGHSIEKDSYNIFMIGNGLSVLFAFLGAWVALDFSLPVIKD